MPSDYGYLLLAICDIPSGTCYLNLFISNLLSLLKTCSFCIRCMSPNFLTDHNRLTCLHRNQEWKNFNRLYQNCIFLYFTISQQFALLFQKTLSQRKTLLTFKHWPVAIMLLLFSLFILWRWFSKWILDKLPALENCCLTMLQKNKLI